MAIEPKEAVDWIALLNAAKQSWQWLAGGIASGVYAVWKYINRRIEKVETAIIEHQKTLVTRQQLTEHTEAEDRKFDELFGQTREMGKQLERVITHLEEINGSMRIFRDRQTINEAKIAESEKDIAAIKERHRLE